MASAYQDYYQPYADKAANQYGIPTEIFRSLISQESKWNPNAQGTSGEYGLTQLMPGTASDLGADRYNPVSNINGGAKYLSQMFQRFGNWRDALAAYNAGPGNVSAGYGYADTVLKGAGSATPGEIPPSQNSVANWISNFLYGQNPALQLNSGGQITDAKSGQTLNAPESFQDFISQSLFTIIGLVAIAVLIFFGISSLSPKRT